MTIQSNNHKNCVSLCKKTSLLLVIMVIMLSGCSFPTRSGARNTRFSSSELQTPLIDIEFILLLSQPLSGKEKIVIEILDEVTGLPYNAQPHELKTTDPLSYRVELSFPAGSIIKYRYVRLSGDAAIYESGHYNRPVRYRMALADAPRTISDILHAWGSEPAGMATGTLSGSIIDQKSQKPVPDLIVHAGGQRVLTDANGIFELRGVAAGLQNVVFYAMDGKYHTHQQEALIAPRAITPVELEMTPAKPVIVRFNVTSPDDALGAPIYLAGSLQQVGNTFTDLNGGLSLSTGQMPAMVMTEEGIYHLDLQLYEGADLHYKFTLGDGYWNAEQDSSTDFFTRQLVVPDHDVSLEHTIEAWRVPDVGPVTFELMFPITTPKDEMFIQFKQQDWTAPIPLWPLGEGKFLYILYSPLDKATALSYRVCRNADCILGVNKQSDSDAYQITPAKNDQLVLQTINDWKQWYPVSNALEENQIPLPAASDNFKTVIELLPETTPDRLPFTNTGLTKIAQSGTQTVIFAPQWVLDPSSGILQPQIGTTPFYHQNLSLSYASQLLGMEIGYFPQIGPADQISKFWLQGSHDESWWNAWFDTYNRFVLNYATIAENTGSQWLIIGGDDVLPAFKGGTFPDGAESTVPEKSVELWQELITDIRSEFSGVLLWAASAHHTMTPLPEFIGEFDGIYLSIDSPLSTANDPSFDEIAFGFSQVIDNLIYEVYRSTDKPLILALAYPSVEDAAKGCLLINSTCQNDGIFSNTETNGFPVDLDEQHLIYSAILPIVASRDWIKGVAIRGYDPTLEIQDGSSSIAGKPALNLIFGWYNEIELDQ